MTAVKNRTHLTPDEVQEFINLGVDFGTKTSDVWLHQLGEGWFSRTIPNDIGFISEAKECYHIDNILPAPNLQEVLEMLPQYIDGCLLDICKDGVWIMEYIAYGGSYHTDSNALTCAVNLLRWVCKNHPETLTKTE